MKLRRKTIWICAGLGVLLIGFLVSTHYRAKWRMENYKQQLIAQGEKLKVAELIRPMPPAEQNAAFAFTISRGLNTPDYVTPMRMVAPGKARVGWREIEPFESIEAKTNVWLSFRPTFEANKESRKEMREALELPHFHYDLDYQNGFALLLPHLAGLKAASQHLSAAVVWQLHEGDAEGAFADLIACITLPARFKNEPLLISQLVRIAMAAIAMNATWDSLQYPDWTEEQLAAVQRAWESFDAFETIDASLVMERALGGMMFEDARRDFSGLQQMMDIGMNPGQTGFFQDIAEFGQSLAEDPLEALKGLAFRFPGYLIWKWWWSYEDERNILDYWQQTIDGFRAGRANHSFAEVLTDLNRAAAERKEDRRLFLSGMLGSLRSGFITRLLTVQVQRDMTITALALKRFHLHHHRYPAQLDELVPDYLQSVPHDLWDGRPLRYRLFEEGEFLLYSIGENAIDDGGNPEPASKWPSHVWNRGQDWVWPRPATAEEVAAWEKSQRK
jgi:hypothetical protein